MHRRLGVHVSFCRSVTMDKWTYRQIYRAALGGNARAREHWKRCGIDPYEKIEAKYTSNTAQQYKRLLEKDVAEACARGLSVLQIGGGAGPSKVTVAEASDPFAAYLNGISQPPPVRCNSEPPKPLAHPAIPVVAKVATAGANGGSFQPPPATLPASASLSPVFGVVSSSPSPTAIPKAGVRKAGGLGARKVSTPAAPAAQPLPTEPAEVAPATAAAPPPPVAFQASPAPTRPAAVPKQPYRPIAPLPKAQQAPAASCASASALSSAWDDLEASTNKPAPAASGTNSLFRTSRTPAATPSAAPPKPAPVRAEAPVIAAPVASPAPAPAAPFNPLSIAASPFSNDMPLKPTAKAGGVHAKRLGASRAPAMAPAGFGDFGFDEAEPVPTSSGPARTTGPTVAGADWGWGNALEDEPPPVAPVPLPAADPWDAPAMRSSLFAYDAPSLHAAAAAAPAPAPQPKPKPEVLRPPQTWGGMDFTVEDTNAGAAQFVSRSTYPGATALLSADFAQQAAVAPSTVPDHEAMMDREVWLERFAGASALGSADLRVEQEQQGGLVRKLAETSIGAAAGAGKKIGGWLGRS